MVKVRLARDVFGHVTAPAQVWLTSARTPQPAPAPPAAILPRGFERIADMLLAAMKVPTFGVMIARGELAVECGFQRLAEVQEELLWICEAGHVPVVWATQVLEGLAKEGMPSRAKITDAAMGHRAGCVMLNKGAHIVSAAARSVTFEADGSPPVQGARDAARAAARAPLPLITPAAPVRDVAGRP